MKGLTDSLNERACLGLYSEPKRGISWPNGQECSMAIADSQAPGVAAVFLGAPLEFNGPRVWPSGSACCFEFGTSFQQVDQNKNVRDGEQRHVKD